MKLYTRNKYKRPTSQRVRWYEGRIIRKGHIIKHYKKWIWWGEEMLLIRMTTENIAKIPVKDIDTFGNK